MKKIKKLMIFIILFSFIFLTALYLCLIFILPLYINSEKFNRDMNFVLKQKYDVTYTLKGLKFSVSPLLSPKIEIDGFELSNELKNKSVSFDGLKLEYGTFKKNPVKIVADNLVIEHQSSEDKSKKSNFSLKKYRELIEKIELKNSRFVFSNANNTGVNVEIPFFVFSQKDLQNKILFNAIISSPVLNKEIIVGNDGSLFFVDDDLFSDKLTVSFGNSKIEVDGLLYGTNGKTEFNVAGENVPVSELQSSLLYFQKLRKKDKVFIENFYDFSGTAKIDLKVTNDGLFGNCTAKNLSAKTLLFDVPVIFKNAVFDFSGRQINSYASGMLGADKVNSIFMLEGMATENQTVNGVIKSNLTNKTVQKYIPHTRIKGNADTTVYYGVENHDISVNYLLKINKGSELYYKTADLGLEDKNRQLFVKTFKHENVLKIVSYDYSLVDDFKKSKILTGEGLFKKENGKFNLDYITCKTDEYAPVSVTGSFGEYLHGGVFKGDLKYSRPEKQITGEFLVLNSSYKDFYLEQAEFSADKKEMNITASGTYNDELFDCRINAENDFGNNKIKINEMKLFLDKFHIKRGGNKNPRVIENGAEITEKVADNDITIESWDIGVNKILSGNIKVEHIFLKGNLKNNIFKFKSENAKFADGVLFADGLYNFNNHSSTVNFHADNIDSNLATYMVLGLENQVNGLASVRIKAQTEDSFDKINAHTEFDIKQGFLPQIGSTEFIVKKSNKSKKPVKIKIQDFVNIDISKEKALESRLKGTFDIEDYDVENIYVTAQQQFLSLLVKGNYAIDSQEADLNLWGKYNKNAGKKVKILSVPLTWIVKIVFRPEKTKEKYRNELNQVPKIQACGDEEQNFRVKMKGNLNTKDIDVELKRIF